MLSAFSKVGTNIVRTRRSAAALPTLRTFASQSMRPNLNPAVMSTSLNNMGLNSISRRNSTMSESMSSTTTPSSSESSSSSNNKFRYAYNSNSSTSESAIAPAILLAPLAFMIFLAWIAQQMGIVNWKSYLWFEEQVVEKQILRRMSSMGQKQKKKEGEEKK